MATSRTGTAQWKKLVRAKRYAKQQDEVTPRCPRCSTVLDFDAANTPASAELDHIIPHSHGGEDTWENTEIVCHACNRSKGAKFFVRPSVAHDAPLRNTGRF